MNRSPVWSGAGTEFERIKSMETKLAADAAKLAAADRKSTQYGRLTKLAKRRSVADLVYWAERFETADALDPFAAVAARRTALAYRDELALRAK